MVKMYHYTTSEVSMSRHSKVIARTDRHTDSMKTLPSGIKLPKQTGCSVSQVYKQCGLQHADRYISGNSGIVPLINVIEAKTLCATSRYIDICVLYKLSKQTGHAIYISDYSLKTNTCIPNLPPSIGPLVLL